jgi:DNA-binding Lrp family transcriptional regulator
MQSQGEIVVTSQEGGRWVSLQEAASRLRLSTDTVRRRVKQGALESRKVPTRYGPAWQVRLDGLPAPLPDRDLAGAPAVAELVRLVEDLQDRLLRMAERIGYLQGQLQQRGGGADAPSGPADEEAGVDSRA